MLNAETWGEPRGGDVVLLHGFTQSARSWGAVGEALGRRHPVTAIDAPGHGLSAEVEADLVDGADLMVDAAPSRAAWLGYSMGGRYALHVALRHPDAVERLVLVSTTAGIDDPAERASRRANDAALAERATSDGLEAFVRWWVSQPMFAGLEDPQMASRLGGSARGLASSLRLAGTGSQQPLWNRLRELGSIPVLVVAGEDDAKYRQHAVRLAAGIGLSAQLRVIEGAGHACHLEQPERFIDAVVPFIDAGRSPV